MNSIGLKRTKTLNVEENKDTVEKMKKKAQTAAVSAINAKINLESGRIKPDNTGYNQIHSDAAGSNRICYQVHSKDEQDETEKIKAKEKKSYSLLDTTSTRT